MVVVMVVVKAEDWIRAQARGASDTRGEWRKLADQCAHDSSVAA
jgi:hypothetical protein